MSDNGPRYAIYFAPDPASPLWRFGRSVLGADAETGEGVAFEPALEAAWPNWAGLTSEPRKYGFHATLKAPFRLRTGLGCTDLIEAVERFAGDHRRCEVNGLRVSTLGRFVALVPVGDVARLKALAASVVDAFELLRAPLSETDRARRLKSSLTRAQTYYLDTFGYPYVHDEFRFHMTLTGGLPTDVIPNVQARLADLYSLTVPEEAIVIGSLSVFRQDHSGARFRVVARVPLL